MSIIGNALAGGLADGMRVVGQQMMAREQMDGAKEQLAMKLKAERDNLLTRLAAAAKEGELNRQAELEKAKIQKRSNFEDRPDLYGAESKPVDRAKFEKTVTTRVDDSEYSDAVSRRMAPLKEEMSFDQAGYDAAEQERFARNRKGRVETDLPQHADDLQKGRSREIANKVMAKDPAGTDAAAAMLTAEGKDRFKMSTGGNSIIDQATGQAQTTDIGNSVINKNNRAPQGRAGGGNAESEKTARANKAAAERLLRSAEASLNSLLKKEPPLGAKARAEHQANIDSARALVARREREFVAAGRSLSTGSESKGDNAGSGKKDFSGLWSR